MTTDAKYNGWTNYETWLVNLWLTNDSGSCEWLEEQARELLAEHLESEDPRAEATYALSQALEALHDDALEEINFPAAGVFSDLLNAALRAVNWYEIAESAISELDIWCVRFNAPGCLPDSEPVFFTDYDDARDALVDIMREHADAGDTLDQDLESAAEQLSSVRTPEPVALCVSGLVYVIERV